MRMFCPMAIALSRTIACQKRLPDAVDEALNRIEKKE
jgi:hypothetical protein